MTTPRSHLTQVLLNNYDPSDIRVRTYSHTIDAQIYNIAANAIEDLDLRYDREVKSRFIQTSPIGLDNRGLYYAASLPNTFVLPDEGSDPPLNEVKGLRNGVWITLNSYDDRLAKPARIEIDPSRSAVPFSSPKLFDWTSDGSPQYREPGTYGWLPIPTALTFWMEGAQVSGDIDIIVTGLAFPYSAWQKYRRTTSETVTYGLNAGIVKTTTVWASISSVVIRNAPEGVRIACWQMPFNLPADIDVQRPHTTPRDRDITFDRYWQISGQWIDESYHGGPGLDLVPINRYSAPEAINDLVVDPFAYTIQAVSDTKLYTIDRRMRFPERLDVTAITSDPPFSINVVFDSTRTSSTVRYVRLETLEHAHALPIQSFRFIVEEPSGSVYCIDAKGNRITYSGAAGWSTGSPTNVVIPLSVNGTYVISLECLDQQGTLSVDRCPYLNGTLEIISELDLSDLVPEARGIARDSLDRLWIWTGDYAVPVKIHYDAYVLDTDSRTVFLTDPFDQVSVS